MGAFSIQFWWPGCREQQQWAIYWREFKHFNTKKYNIAENFNEIGNFGEEN